MSSSKCNNYLKCYRRKKNFLKKLSKTVKPVNNNYRNLFGNWGNINFYIRDTNFTNCSSGENIISNEAPTVLESNEIFIDSISNDDFDYNDEVVENMYREVELSLEDRTFGDVGEDINFESKLAEWAVKYKIPHIAVSELLVLLRSEGKSELPKDARTLLHTPRNVVIQTMGTGFFWYYGIENCLRIAFRQLNQTIQVLLNFNVDGLPLFRSSKFQFWPILMNIAHMPEIRPMAVAIYFGDAKPPSSEEFLRQHVSEINALILNGMKLANGSKILIKVNAYIADTPARAFIKCVKTHTAYSSCTKCNVVGEFDRSGNHMSFPRLDCRRRTHSDFISKTDEDHHLWNPRTKLFYHTPLEEIEGIDMIQNFPIADSMHLIELGITKRCLNGWVNGSYNFRNKLPSHEANSISTWLTTSNDWLPSEITRQARGLDTLSFWKSIEYRTFLLYLGPVIMKHFLQSEVYEHFWYLAVATTIYSCERYINIPAVFNVAKNLMNDYVEEFIVLYGSDSISSNVHNLIHVHDDVMKFGSLRNTSAYPFESTLYWLKCLLKNGSRPLSQVAKRINEMNKLNSGPSKPTAYPILSKKFNENSQMYGRVKFSTFMLSNDRKNKWFLTKNCEIIEMIHATTNGTRIKIHGRNIRRFDNFNTAPFSSHHLNIYSADIELGILKEYPAEHIKCKLICLHPYDMECRQNKQSFNAKKGVFFPLIHTL